MKNIFTDHPKSIGESYFQHLYFAFLFGLNMIIGGLACIIHAFLPFLFKKTGSDVLIKMTHHFVERMPQLEERVMCIHECIEKKKHAHGRNN